MSGVSPEAMEVLISLSMASTRSILTVMPFVLGRMSTCFWMPSITGWSRLIQMVTSSSPSPLAAAVVAAAAGETDRNRHGGRGRHELGASPRVKSHVSPPVVSAVDAEIVVGVL